MNIVYQQLLDKTSPNKQFERVQTKHRNSIQHSRINLNTQAMKSINNELLRVNDFIMGVLENADPEDKKVYDIDHELKRINESRNATIADEFINFRMDCDGFERSPTKGQSPQNQRRDRDRDRDREDNSSYIRFKSSKGVKKSKYNNSFNTAQREDSMKQLDAKISLMKENSSVISPISSSFKRRNNRRQSYQSKTPDFFNKLLLKNSRDNDNDIKNEGSSNHIRSNVKHSTILLKRKKSPIDGTISKKVSRVIDDNDAIPEQNETGNYLKESSTIEGNKIQDLIPLNNTNIKEFDGICSNLKDSIILPASELKKINSNNLKEAKENNNTISINNDPNDIIQTSDDEEAINQRKKDIQEIRYRCLSRQNKLVYDSLSDEEIDDEILGIFYVHPASYFKIGFDLIMIVLTFYAFISTPLYLAFDFYSGISIKSWKYILELIIDSFNILDLLIGFFTAFHNFEEQLITRNKPIAKYYLSHGFAVDFLCAIPFNSLLIYWTKALDLIFTYVSDNNKLLHFTRLLRIIKIFKVFKSNSFTSIAYKALGTIQVLAKWARLWSSLMMFFLVVHLFSCIFIFLGQLDYPNWLSVQGLENSSQTNVYLGSFYYICATVFTIGYGDILSVSIYERFYNLFLLIIGIVMYSWAVTSLSNYVQTVDSKTSEYQKNMAILEHIRVTHEKMPHVLYDKISRFLTYDYNNEKKDKSEIINNLPIGLRNTLIIEMHKSIINNFVFFKNFDNTDFIIQVILKFKALQVIKNEKLVNDGDYIEDIIFVKRGSLALEIPLPVVIKDETLQSMQKKTTTFNFTRSVTRSVTTSKFAPERIEYDTFASNTLKGKKLLSTLHTQQSKQPKIDQQYIKIIEIRRNEHFGDILMFLNKRSPLTVKVRSKVAEIFLLKKTDAVLISMQYPRIWRKIIKNSLFNMEQIERLINKAHKFFYIHNEGHRNTSEQKKNYYHRDFTKKNTMLNSNKLFNNLSNEACELQSIPSSEGEMTDEENEYSDDEDYEGIEDSKTNNGNQEEKAHDNRLKKHYDPNAIVEEENDDDEDEDEDEEKKEEENDDKSVSSNNTLKLQIKNTKVNFDDIDEETKGNQTSKTKQKKDQYPSLIDENVSHDSHHSHSKEKLSQVNTLPFSQEEINQENYPYELSIDLKDNSVIPSIMPKDTISWNFHGDFHNNTHTGKGLVGNNEPNDNYVQFFNNNSDQSREKYNKKPSNNKNSSSSGKLPGEAPKIIFGDLEISHMNSFSVFSHFDRPIPQHRESAPQIEVAISPPPSKTKGLESLKSMKSMGKLSIPLKTISSEIDSPIEQRRQSKMLFYQHKDSFLKDMASPRIKKTNTNAQPRKSMGIIPLKKQLSKIPKPTNSSNMLDKISQNIESNSYMLNDPKGFYKNYFSQVRKDGKENSKGLSKKLGDIMRIIEKNNPNKPKGNTDK